MDRDFLTVFLLITSVKFLFIPMYHSTDFEVHRNWKAITHSLNYKHWYYEDRSQWTLDYPPFFAWFECGLSQLATYFDENLLNVDNLNYRSQETLFFMRISVIFSDLLYAYSVLTLYKLLKKNSKKNTDPWIKPEVVLAMLMLWNPGLLLVDHIHFQYNGFLNGFLFLSISALLQNNFIESAVWFCYLLNLKHIYVYYAPAYFIFFLKSYCFNLKSHYDTISLKKFSLVKFIKLSSTVAGVFALSFGPFIYAGQFSQVLKRIFPVQRGLTHAYWAANFWALYNFLDRILAAMMGFITGNKAYLTNTATRGLVQQYKHVVLPTVNVQFTIILTVLSILPFLWLLWKKPNDPYLLLKALVGCAFGSFLFGYHVHEKAVLMIILPLTIIAINDSDYISSFVMTSTVGHFALFPLLHKSGETPIKIVLLIMHATYAYTSLKNIHKLSCKYTETYTVFQLIILFGLLPLQCFYSFGNIFFNLDVKYPFLPLMFISVYCAIGMLYCWIKYCKLVIRAKL